MCSQAPTSGSQYKLLCPAATVVLCHLQCNYISYKERIYNKSYFAQYSSKKRSYIFCLKIKIYIKKLRQSLILEAQFYLFIKRSYINYCTNITGYVKSQLKHFCSSHFFRFSLWFTDFRHGLLHVNCGRTSHSREISGSHATSRTFEVQSARSHVVEVQEQRNTTLTQGSQEVRSPPPLQGQSEVGFYSSCS